MISLACLAHPPATLPALQTLYWPPAFSAADRTAVGKFNSAISGTIALGHPICAFGCCILVTLIHEMMRRDVHRELASLCMGGIMGIAMVIER